MFKLSADPRFTHDVTIRVPVDGGYEEQTLKVTFRMLDLAEELGDLSTLEAQQALLRRVIVDLADLVGDDGKPVPYSDAVRDRVIGTPCVRGPIFQHYFEAIAGGSARLGN